MKLARLALLSLKTDPAELKGLVLRRESLEVGPLRKTTQENIFLLCSSVSLRFPPKMTKQGLVVIPNKPREIAEEAIEHYSNIVAIASHGERKISSANPSVALVSESKSDDLFLSRAAGFIRRAENRAVPRAMFQLKSTHIENLYDRLDGVAILAEALGHHHQTGRFHELIRLFERAFAIGGHALIGPLAAFLGSSSLGYTSGEIAEWINIRDGVTHGDRRKEILFESDVAWVCGRLVQAGYDVLLNKLDWHSGTSGRRETWQPTQGTIAPWPRTDLFVNRGEALNIEFQLFDEFRRFPSNLKGNVSTLPDGWWSKPFVEF